MTSQRSFSLRPSTSLLALVTLFGTAAGCNALLGNNGPGGGLGGQGGEPFGGDSSVGGNLNSGGTHSGGRASGGAGSGGKAAGGSNSGGTNSGGSSSGGKSSGGSAPNSGGSGSGGEVGYCGDGEPQGGELCDDGDEDNRDECTMACAPPSCGDGYWNGHEGCDDGGVDGGDGCSSVCQSEATQIAAGLNFTCALRPNRSVQCWGLNSTGQLGLGDTRDRGGDVSDMVGDDLTVILNQDVRAIDAGRAHACAIMWDRTVRCWGANEYGQLGLGSSSPRGNSPDGMGDALPAVDLGPGVLVKSLALGGDFSCALTTDLRVICWGRSDSGQLGRGDSQGYPHGTLPEHMGAALVPVLLGDSRTAKAIVAGEAHVCAILDDDTVKCWGDNEFGQLGRENTEDRGLCNCLNEDQHIELGAGRTARELAAGAFHTCALLDDYTVKCWGKNDFGQLGKASSGNVGDEVGDMGEGLRATDLGGQLGASITAGEAHTCVMLDSEAIKCWGQNIFGQLGLNDVRNRGAAPNDADMGANLPVIDLGGSVLSVTTGATHTCATYTYGAFRCWGSNYKGELGLGDTEPRGDDAEEVGSRLSYVSLR